MSNEEIALLIKAGHTELYSQLWEQCKKFIRKKAYQRTLSHDNSVIDTDDLTQGGYFALIKAVEYYEPGKGYKLLTYLTRALQTVFCQAYGIRTSKRDASNNSLSLDDPLTGDAEHCRGDTIPDDKAGLYIENIAERDLHERAATVLTLALDTIPENEAAFIVSVYYDGLTLNEACTVAGYDGTVKSGAVHCSALNRLRYCKYAPLMKKYLSDMECYDAAELESMAYSRTGLNSFRNSHESSVERAVFMRVGKHKIRKV